MTSWRMALLWACLWTMTGALTVSMPARADVVLRFEQLVETADMPSPDTKAKAAQAPTRRQGELVVMLAERYFSVRDGGLESIYDFARRRIITIDRSTRRYVDGSLFAHIGFSSSEFRNRIFVSGALDAAKVENNPMVPVLMEHLFSLRQKDKQNRVNEKEQDGKLLFTAADKELASFSKATRPLPAAQRDMWLRFVRYRFGGHPAILDRLRGLDGVPTQFQLVRYDAQRTTYSLTLTSIESLAAPPYSLDGLTPGDLQAQTDEEVTFLRQQRARYSVQAVQRSTERLLQQAEQHYAARRYLDTLLAYIEYNLQTGRPLPEQIKVKQPMLNADVDVQQLTQSLQPKGKEAAQVALKTLQQLQARSTEHAHVLKIFEANIRIAERDAPSSIKLFRAALGKNPFIAGVYKDMGDLYFSGYRADLAWQCWDLGRQIAPDHPMFGKINRFESSLLRDYPEFF